MAIVLSSAKDRESEEDILWTIEYANKPAVYKDEDRAIIIKVPKGHVVGVFDGHFNSSDAANECARSFPELLRDVEETSAVDVLTSAFDKVADRTIACIGGSTASVVCLWDTGNVTAAVLGDSPILARLNKNVIVLGPSHNVGSNETEKEAAIYRGGDYRYPYVGSPSGRWGLQIGRSFEPMHRRPIISVTPEFMIQTIAPSGWVAVMSDGIIDTLSTDFQADKTELIQLIDGGASAEVIVERFQPRKGDDAALIICRFGK